MRAVTIGCIALLIASVSATVRSSGGAVKAPASTCTGSNNPFPVNREAPVLVSTVPNGKRFLAGQANDTFHVAHLYGSHYEMGYAHGKMFGEFFPDVWTKFIAYIEAEAEHYVPWIPKWLADLVIQYGAPAALQLTVDWTKPFTPQMYIDEMQGIADGSGYDFAKIYQVNMFPELIKAACTIVGATKSATVNGKIAHLRDLDIDVSIPIKDWPLVTVMHGNGTQPKVVNFGWIMMVGSLTGISQHPIGIGEKVWLRQEKDDGVKGEPWMFILRDVLYTSSLDEALAVMANANRTCAIHVGVGDGGTNEFRGVQMDKVKFEVFNWTSINYPDHPIIEDVMYWDMHSQPDNSHYCLPYMLNQWHGNITAEMMAVNISSIGQTGNFHSVSFDYGRMTAYFANARKSNVTVGGANAFERQYTFLDLAALMSLPQ